MALLREGDQRGNEPAGRVRGARRRVVHGLTQVQAATALLLLLMQDTVALDAPQHVPAHVHNTALQRLKTRLQQHCPGLSRAGLEHLRLMEL